MIIKVKKDSKFFLTFFEKIEETDGLIDLGERICKGFFNEYEDAYNALCNTAKTKPSRECKYAVIELVDMGYGPICSPSTRLFFEFDKASSTYRKIDEPDSVKNFVNFAIN